MGLVWWVVLCILGLLVLAILAVFSARYRPLAREALACVFRRVTLRKCTTGLDRRLKAMVTGRLVASHPAAARFLHRHLEPLAWLLVVLVVGATANLAYGFYNFYRYGSCSGPTGTGFCVFDPSGTHRRYSGIRTGHRGETTTPGDGGNPAIGPPGAPVTIIEFGSYTCPYTREAEPAVRDILRQHADQVRMVFRHFPLDGPQALRADVPMACEDTARGTSRPPATGPNGSPPDPHDGATRAAIAADCAGAQGRFWEYHQRLTASAGTPLTCAGFTELGRGLGLDDAAFARCLGDPAMREHVRRDFEDGVRAGVYGTPTFFIDGTAVVAPSRKELADAVERALRGERP